MVRIVSRHGMMRLSRPHLGPYDVKVMARMDRQGRGTCEVVKVQQIMGQSPNVRDERKEGMTD